LALIVPLTDDERLFLQELKIDYVDKRYPYDASFQESVANDFEKRGMSLTRKLPILEIDGHILTQVGDMCRCLLRL
jgi:hypothetical protein